jgi:hypothetical protein
MSTPFKMKGFSGFGNSPLKNEENLIEKLRRRMKETQIFSPEMQSRMQSVSYGKKLHKDVLDSITNISDEKKKKLLAEAKEKIKKKQL